MRLASPTVRSGLSLLEVIIALAVFLFSLVGLGFLVTGAGSIAQEASFRTEASRLCQSKLAEVAAGAVEMNPQSDVAFEEDPAFTWSLDVEPGATQGLYNVTVRVGRKRPDGTQMEATLSQMVLDPKITGSALDEPGATTGMGN